MEQIKVKEEVKEEHTEGGLLEVKEEFDPTAFDLETKFQCHKNDVDDSKVKQEHTTPVNIPPEGTSNYTPLNKHTTEWPFVCSVCKRKFKQEHHLKSHVVVHSREKLFSCSTCKRIFANEVVLKDHMVVHSNTKMSYSCRVCDYKCNVKRYFKEHILKHAVRNLFSCSICVCKFTRKDLLDRHMVVHTRE